MHRQTVAFPFQCATRLPQGLTCAAVFFPHRTDPYHSVGYHAIHVLPNTIHSITIASMAEAPPPEDHVAPITCLYIFLKESKFRVAFNALLAHSFVKNNKQSLTRTAFYARRFPSVPRVVVDGHKGLLQITAAFIRTIVAAVFAIEELERVVAIVASLVPAVSAHEHFD